MASAFDARSLNLVPDTRPSNQPLVPNSWVSVSSTPASGALPATLYTVPPSPSNTVLSSPPGFGAPVSGWGRFGTPRIASAAPFAAPSQLYQAERFMNSTGMAGVFVAEGAPMDGPLGFSFEKVENGPARGFTFVMAVTAVEQGSWASDAGIEVGCTILRLNEEDVTHMTVQELSMKLIHSRPLILVLAKPNAPTGFPQQPQQTFGSVDWAGVRESGYPAKGTNEDYYESVVDVASKALYHDFPEASKSLLEVPPGMLKMFPTAFLLFSLAVFVMPIYLVLYVGADINTRQWFPDITRLVLILPVVYVVTCLAHVCKRRPSKFFVTVSLLGSCILLLAVSDVILLQAYEKGPMFAAATDCMSWGEKRDVQQQWDLAQGFYNTCNGVNKTKPTRIQDCPNYAKVAALHPYWGYLEQLEEKQQCGGWCKSAAPLWQKGPVQDACAPVVAQVIHDKIEWCLRQVTFYTVFTLLITAVLLITAPPVFKKYGVEW